MFPMKSGELISTARIFSLILGAEMNLCIYLSSISFHFSSKVPIPYKKRDYPPLLPFHGATRVAPSAVFISLKMLYGGRKQILLTSS